MKKPELLAPVGQIESFYAALNAGADAVYLGTDQFNARQRSRQFQPSELAALIEEAHAKGVKVYVTLNTLVKNVELPELINSLHILNLLRPDAVIVQDIGVLYLARQFFPELELHASTQMGVHNSVGVCYMKEHGVSRFIMARELTMPELKQITERCPNAELEVFVHGALCYSLSGYCLFSSYLGGMSANRGQCKQPCRRKYSADNGQSKYLFNLRDLQLTRFLPELSKIGISTLKIEGRMKSPAYVYNTVRAYRMALDDPERIDEACELLKADLARAKCSYFPGGSIDRAISQTPFTGRWVGVVEYAGQHGYAIIPDIPLAKGDIIRVQPKSGRHSDKITLTEEQIDGNRVLIDEKETIFKKGDRVYYLGGCEETKFQTWLPVVKKEFQTLPHKKTGSILDSIKPVSDQKELLPQLWLRIDSPEWLRKIYLPDASKIIMKFTLNQWREFDVTRPFIKKHLSSFIVQLPRFIQEKQLEEWRELLLELHNNGIADFMVSHISQKLLLLGKARCHTCESVYLHNWAALKWIKREGFDNYILPLEADIETYTQLATPNAVVPLYYLPELFYSRMPVNVESFQEEHKQFQKHTRAGFSIIVPEHPVALFQFRKKMTGINKFLMDLSWHKPSKHLYKRLIRQYNNQVAVQPATLFNLRRSMT
ncbi:MAG: U32 family peptidase [Candidatus Cloacimonetes bacterium]|nr:U32 family peptidase [Candidatus Cloacimonadota bacterium]